MVEMAIAVEHQAQYQARQSAILKLKRTTVIRTRPNRHAAVTEADARSVPNAGMVACDSGREGFCADTDASLRRLTACYAALAQASALACTTGQLATAPC